MIKNPKMGEEVYCLCGLKLPRERWLLRRYFTRVPIGAIPSCDGIKRVKILAVEPRKDSLYVLHSGHMHVVHQEHLYRRLPFFMPGWMKREIRAVRKRMKDEERRRDGINGSAASQQ